MPLTCIPVPTSVSIMGNDIGMRVLKSSKIGHEVGSGLGYAIG